jgi:dipeptidyl aminopeptidase/acylaminoacyl peptidase
MTSPIERYIHIRAAFAPTFSADGRFLAFLSDITGMPQVWQIDLGAAEDSIPWPQQLSFAPDRVLYARFSPVQGDGRLLFAHDIGGDENAQLFLLDTATGQEQALTKGYESAMHLPGEWAADGRSFLFAANRRHPGQFDLYRQWLDGRPAEMLWQHEASGYLFEQVWSPDGKRLALVRAAHSAAHDLLELDIATGKARQLNPTGAAARYTGISYSKDGRSLYANTDLGADFLHVARLDLVSGAWETLINPNADTELLAQSPNGRYLAFTTNRDGNSRLEVIDLATGMARPAPEPATRPGVIGWYDEHLTFSTDSERLAFSYTSATRASDVYVWNVDMGDDAMRRVTDSSHGGLPVTSFVTPEVVRYESFDGREIPAFFYQPAPNEEPAPVIVLVHGGPESQFRAYFHFLVQYFVQNGYAVLAPNVRGSSGYGKVYSHLDDVEKRMDSVADLAYAAQWLKQQPGVDPDRLVVYGGSYGGFMVLSALTTYPDLWAAGINIVGISNFVTFLENTSDYRRSHRESEYGSLAEDRAFLEEISPLNHVQHIAAPLMVVHGANDPRVPLSEAEQLVAALEQRGVPVRFLVFDDEGHGVAKLKNKLTLYPAILSFLDEVL